MAEVNVNRKKNAKCKPRGKPFEAGNKLGGRKPIPQAFKELAEKHSIPALQKAIEIMESDEADYKSVLKAIEIVLDRGIGKPTQPIDANINGQLEFVVVIDDD